MAKMLTRCPVCEATLGISELACGRCQTRISGAFDPCRFCRLAPEHLAFLETFLRCEGNLSRVEKELGVSYPTVRNRLSAALAALGFGNGVSEGETHRASEPPPPPDIPFPPAPPEPPETALRRSNILDSLARGDMSAEDAAVALRDLS